MAFKAGVHATKHNEQKIRCDVGIILQDQE